MQENQNEYIKLSPEWVNEKWVDKFVVDEELLKTMYDRAVWEDGKKPWDETFEAFKKEILLLVNEVNNNDESLLDTWIRDFSWSINVDETQEKLALWVVKEKIISKLNSNIDKLLWDKFDLQNQLFSVLRDENLLPEQIIDDIKLSIDSDYANSQKKTLAANYKSSVDKHNQDLKDVASL